MKRWIHASEDSTYVALMVVDDKPIGFYDSLLRDRGGSIAYITKNIDKAKKFNSNKRKPIVSYSDVQWMNAPYINLVIYDPVTLESKKNTFLEYYEKEDRYVGNTIYTVSDIIKSINVEMIPLEEAEGIRLYSYDDFRYLDLENYIDEYLL